MLVRSKMGFRKYVREFKNWLSKVCLRVRVLVFGSVFTRFECPLLICQLVFENWFSKLCLLARKLVFESVLMPRKLVFERPLLILVIVHWCSKTHFRDYVCEFENWYLKVCLCLRKLVFKRPFLNNTLNLYILHIHN